MAGLAHAGDQAYIEFLWSPASRDALARGEAQGFVLDEAQDHRICVVAIGPVIHGSLRIDARDASGKPAGSQRYDGFNGSKECFAANLDLRGAPGEWMFNVYADGKLVATKAIEVARTLRNAPFLADPRRPYVLGRPNYDPAIPPGSYAGRLSWIMTVDADGTVADVVVEAAEGAGELMRDRAVAAGYITLFPPDPSRMASPYKVRQEYQLEADR